MNRSEVWPPWNDTVAHAPSPHTSQEHFEGFLVLMSLKPIFIPLYALLTLVGVSGNLLLILVITRTKRLHNATNFLLGNLALSDLLVCLTCVPISAAYAFEPRGWVYGAPLCYLVALLQPATVHVSVLSLTAIALDRYVVVAYPIRRRVAVKWCVLIAAFIWLASAALALPAALNTVIMDLGKDGPETSNGSAVEMMVCEEMWSHMEEQRLAYSCAMVLVSYLLPLVAVSASYCAISMTLRSREPPGGAHCSVNVLRTWHQKRRKTFRLLVMSVGSFAFCWLPLQVLDEQRVALVAALVFNLIHDLDPGVTLISKRYFNVIQLSCHWVAMSSTCWNPFIYASLHHKFARALRHRCRGCGRCLARPQRSSLARAAGAGGAGSGSGSGGGGGGGGRGGRTDPIGRSTSRSPVGVSSLSSKVSRIHTLQQGRDVSYSPSAGTCSARLAESTAAAVVPLDSPVGRGGARQDGAELSRCEVSDLPDFTPPDLGPHAYFNSSLCADKFP